MEQSGRLAARNPQGAVWLLQVNTTSFRALAWYSPGFTPACLPWCCCLHPWSPASCAGYQSAPTSHLERP